MGRTAQTGDHPPIVQIAGVLDLDEVELLIACGVTHVGIPLALCGRPEEVTEEEAGRIVAAVAGRAQAVWITYLREAERVASLARRLGVAWVQLHGEVSPEEIVALGSLAPDLRILKSLIVRGHDADALAPEVERFAPHVDAFLTDSFDPESGACGATGRTHDWRVSRRIVECSPHPVILAGGLTPQNVAEAIRIVRPAGVDAHTGVEGPDGRKRRDLVELFVARARQAFAEAPARA